MRTSEDKLFLDAISEFQTAFPTLRVPDSTWLAKWLSQYGSQALSDAIQKLKRNPRKDIFTTESVGRAISALLRDGAIQAAAQKLRRP